MAAGKDSAKSGKPAKRKPVRRNNARAEVLAAAERVAAKLGPGRLTIDAVVAESGMSKGGVLYHFPSKSALVEGMINHMVDGSNLRVEAMVNRLQGSPNPTLQALIEVQNDNWLEEEGLSRALMAAVAQDPEHVGMVRDNKREIFERIKVETGDSIGALVLWLAADALSIYKVLNISCFTPEEDRKFHQRLVELSEHLN